LRGTSDIIPITEIMLAHENLEKANLLPIHTGEKILELLQKHNIPWTASSLNIQIDPAIHACWIVIRTGYYSNTHPSRTASPKGRVALEPPRKRFQTV